MSALPADISAYTADGVVVQQPSTATSLAIQALHANARSTIGNEFPTFFDNAADAVTMLTEKASYLTVPSFPHLAVEVQDSLDIGTAIPVGPQVPCFTLIDDSCSINQLLRCRSIAHQFDGDRYALEFLP